MISDTLISPRADSDIRKRSSLYKRRTMTPDFRDILRQRCRERVKAKRGALFDHLRSMSSEEGVRSALSQFIEQDLQELQSKCNLTHSYHKEFMEVLEDEPLSTLAVTEAERWILSEYDRLIEDIDAVAGLAEAVVCPLCMRGTLSAQLGTVTCSQCSLMLPHTVPLVCLEVSIEHAVAAHGTSCDEQPQFTVCPDGDTANLLLLCVTCGHCQQIV